MKKTLRIVDRDGSITFYGVGKLAYLLLLGGLVYVAALAVNDLIVATLQKYVRKEGLLGYLFYAGIAIAMVILVVYSGCWYSPELADYIDLSPI